MLQEQTDKDELVKQDIKSWTDSGLCEAEIFERVYEKYPDLRWKTCERMAFR